MENKIESTSQNMISDSQPSLLLRDDSSEKDINIEDEIETKILSRQIKAYKTTIHDELKISGKKEKNKDLTLKIIFILNNLKKYNNKQTNKFCNISYKS